MDAPFNTPDHGPCRRRGPLPVWVPLALIVVVLTLAAFASSTMTDTRDFAQKHATVLQEHIL